jgi:hypothetical protein
VPAGLGTNGLISIDDLEIGLWLPFNPTTANSIDLSRRRRYFNVMPGTGKHIAGGYTIYFHDQHAVTFPNQTLRALPGSPTWNGDVLVLKNIDEDVVTHITRQDYEIVRELLSKLLIASLCCMFI